MNHDILVTVITFHAFALMLPASMILLYKRPDLWHTALSVFLGFLVGMIDLRSNEVQLPILLLLGFGFFIGFSNREKAWLHAILLAMWVPLGQAFQFWFNPGSVRFGPEVLGSLLAFVPAFLGAYAGVMLHPRVKLNE